MPGRHLHPKRPDGHIVWLKPSCQQLDLLAGKLKQIPTHPEKPRDTAGVREIGRAETHYRRKCRLFCNGGHSLCLGVMNIASKEDAYLEKGKRNPEAQRIK